TTQAHTPFVSWINSESPTISSEPISPVVTQPSPAIDTETSPVHLTSPPSDSIPGRKAIAVYPCEAEHNSELSFQVGEVFEDGKFIYFTSRQILGHVEFGIPIS
ncbi:hypothetical protein AB205_0075670, partial [Aquarana catesbeiana]